MCPPGKTPVPRGLHAVPADRGQRRVRAGRPQGRPRAVAPEALNRLRRHPARARACTRSSETVGGRLRWLPGVAEVAAARDPVRRRRGTNRTHTAPRSAATRPVPWWCAVGDSAAQGVGADRTPGAAGPADSTTTSSSTGSHATREPLGVGSADRRRARRAAPPPRRVDRPPRAAGVRGGRGRRQRHLPVDRRPRHPGEPDGDRRAAAQPARCWPRSCRPAGRSSANMVNAHVRSLIGPQRPPAGGREPLLPRPVPWNGCPPIGSTRTTVATPTGHAPSSTRWTRR